MFTTSSKHHPNGGAVTHCDNTQLEQAIARFQSGDAGSLGEIVQLVEPRALTLVRFHKTNHYRSEDELLSDVNYQLVRNVGKFDPARGSAFTFVSTLIWNVLRTIVTRTRVNAGRHVELDETVAERVSVEPEGRAQEALEDVAIRLRRGMRTTLTDEAELATMRWYTDSFIGGAFELRRHQCSNAAMLAFGLSHDRSRELYDLTLLEIRRLMYDDLPPRKPVHPNQLLGTRARWMMHLAPLMSPQEFAKFVWLARDLSPFVLMLIAPESRSRRQDRNPAIGRENILWVLNGHPEAKPLFAP
jgi:hypothetical protein